MRATQGWFLVFPILTSRDLWITSYTDKLSSITGHSRRTFLAKSGQKCCNLIVFTITSRNQKFFKTGSPRLPKLMCYSSIFRVLEILDKGIFRHPSYRKNFKCCFSVSLLWNNSICRSKFRSSLSLILFAQFYIFRRKSNQCNLFIVIWFNAIDGKTWIMNSFDCEVLNLIRLQCKIVILSYTKYDLLSKTFHFTSWRGAM